jgi:putative transposase
MRLRSTRHARYWCGYHFVWIPKHCRDVLVGEVSEYTRVVLNEILGELGCEPLALEVVPDKALLEGIEVKYLTKKETRGTSKNPP